MQSRIEENFVSLYVLNFSSSKHQVNKVIMKISLPENFMNKI